MDAIVDPLGSSADRQASRPRRVDAQRSLAALLHAAKAVFAEAGVDAPVRDIAVRAGVGVGTVYRHFPQRADLIAAVFRQDIDACADAADRLAAAHPPFEAFARWMQEFVALASTKRGLAQALRSGDPAYDFVPVRRDERLRPAFRALFDAAVTSGDIRAVIAPDDFLDAAATLCMTVEDATPAVTGQLVALLVNGLRCSR